MKVSACGYEADLDSYQLEWFSILVEKNMVCGFIDFMNNQSEENNDAPDGAHGELMKGFALDFVEANGISVEDPGCAGHELWLMWLHFISTDG